MSIAGGFNRVGRTRYGPMIYNIHDVYMGRSIELYGEYGQEELDFLQSVLKQGDVALDVGANIGVHTLSFARAVGPQGAVVAFEPQRLTFQMLCGNVALNSLTNVMCRYDAVGDVRGSISVPAVDPNCDFNFGGIELGTPEPGEMAPLVRLDDFRFPRCNLIKADVEGMEVKVLKGATDLIARTKPMLYVENQRQAEAADLIRFIDSLSYEQFWHVTPLFKPDNFLGNPNNVFGSTGSFNMFCVPRGSPAPTLPPVDVPAPSMPAAPPPGMRHWSY